jgi:CDP-2,3-bis-(O-geranylgeranyl)-sn-glycerol synthase
MILNILYFLLPAAIANIGASASSKLFPNWNSPIDYNKTFRGKRILGNHKTIRGFVCGTLIGFIIYILQIQLYNSNPYFNKISFINYKTLPIYIGLLLSAGALLGDAVKSFFKRQIDIPSGKSWIPFDQTDWVMGAIILSASTVEYTPLFIFLALIVGLVSHVIVKAIGFALKIEQTPL